MTEQPFQTLLAHFLLDQDPSRDVVPLGDQLLFVRMVQALLGEHLPSFGPGARVWVDGETAMRLNGLDGLVEAGLRPVCHGPVGSLPKGFESARLPEGIVPSDRYFAIVGPEGAAGFVGAVSAPEDAIAFRGAWVAAPARMREFLEVIVPEGELAEAAAFLDGLDAAQVCNMAMLLMNTHASILAEHQRDVTLDRADLFSILEILKAISSKRRTHDILFVFVEQIARIVQSDRCSIVRVWGDDVTGHVLASHEDASVVDCTIDLTKYPELGKSLETEMKVVVDDVQREALMAPHAEDLAKANIRSLVVVPILLYDEHIGSLLLRAARADAPFSEREVGFFEVVSEAASNALQRAHLFESIQLANERLEHLAVTDGLTGLHNHRYFMERLEKEVERAMRYHLPLSCLLLDVDDFKKLNDTHGHMTGDAVLREVAQCCTRCVRKVDTLARYGGEEFVIVMPQTGLEGAVIQGERVRRTIAKHQFAGLGRGERVTVSIGVAAFDPDTMADADHLLKYTDDAAYSAKRKGKNQVAVHRPEEEND